MHPTKQDFDTIYRLYKDTFAFDDGGMIDPYFQSYFRLEDCWIIRDNDQIVSMLCAHPHRMYFHSGSLPVRFISGVITVKDKRHHGYMRQCFADLWSETKDFCGLYVLQAYHSEIYTSLGFQQHYFTRYVTYQGITFPDDCVEIASASDCAKCAQIALRQWEGWMDHDVVFYQALLNEAKALNQPLLGFYENDQLMAFARWRQEQATIVVEEILAQSEAAQQRLLGQLASHCTHLLYAIPALENDVQAQGNLMVKMGNSTLCRQSLNRTINTCDDLFQADQRYYHYGWW